MKKQIVSLALGLVIMLASTVSYGAEKKSATDKINTNDNGFTVSSQLDGRAVTKAYDKKGNWVYTIEHYATDNLAKNVLDMVKESYGNYYITNMEKIKQKGEGTIFIVHAEDATSIKTLRVAYGEVELIQDLVKG